MVIVGISARPKRTTEVEVRLFQVNIQREDKRLRHRDLQTLIQIDKHAGKWKRASKRRDRTSDPNTQREKDGDGKNTPYGIKSNGKDRKGGIRISAGPQQKLSE